MRIPGAWTFRNLPVDPRQPDETTVRFNRLTGADRTDRASINSTNNLYVAVHPARGRTALQLAEERDAAYRRDPKTFRNYRSIQVKNASLGAHEGSLQEFTYDNVDTGPRHVLIFRTVVGGTSYDVSLNGPANLFAADLHVFDEAVDTLEITAR
jgi:hypothetical protein